jgi:tetratricopeptide (TPR) repeat protein
MTRTLIHAAVFAVTVAAADSHYDEARRLIAEARGTVNVVRLIGLAWNIGEELRETIRLDPDHLDARLDLVRFYVITPRLLGGSIPKARAESAEIARRDAFLGHFANGYIAYREKQYGTARRAFREAAKAPKASTRILALKWLGWLSQETQQYDEAFWAFEKILSIAPTELSASYEIGRTAVFCRCRVERGDEALVRYLASTPVGDMPTLEEAEELRRKLR